MDFRILGPLEVADGDATVALGGVRQRTLLAILQLNANEVVSADRLIHELWGERSPECGRSALQPVLVHIDDLQWAEPLLLDLLDHIVELSRDAPILLLCTARPELPEDRSTWGGGKLNATTMMLEPLGTAECDALLVQLGHDLDPPARARRQRERGKPTVPGGDVGACARDRQP
jgi:hypothetical protein